MKKDQIQNDLNAGLWLANLEENQVPGTWSFLLNGVVETEDHENYGIASEPSLEFIASLPEGFVSRGDILIPDKNELLVFSYNQSTGTSEIGKVNLITKEYSTYLNDSKYTKKLNFGISKKIKPKFFVKGECREHHVIFVACSTYYVLNISKSFCDVTYEDLLLLPCDCGPLVKLRQVKYGGLDLVGGKYYAFVRLTDEDNNHTNFFWGSDPLILDSPNQIPGEVSENAIDIVVEGNRSAHFEFIEIAIVRNIGFEVSVKLLPKIPFTRTKQQVLLTNHRQFSGIPITIDDIRNKDIAYIRGEDIDIIDGHAVLFNTYGEPNFPILKYSRNLRVRWFAKLAPLSEAHKYTSMPRDEVMSLALSKVWCDGTYSRFGHIPGRRATPYDREKIPISDPRNCTECELERWQVENTASVTKWYCGNPYEMMEDSQVSAFSLKIDKQDETDPNSGCPKGRHCNPGSVYQGIAVQGPCTATCSKSCYGLGCCKNGLCQNCGAKCSGCSGGCSGTSCTGGCSQGCSGNSTGSSYYNTGNEQIGLGVCDVVITYNKTPNCPACDAFDASGVWGQLAAALPQYNVHLVVIDRDPKDYIDISFEFDCMSGNSIVVGRTLDDFVNAITGWCECNEEPEETYDCRETGCIAAGQNGEWRSYQACKDNCSAERTSKWRCDPANGNCVTDLEGPYSTLFECSKHCNINGQERYRCTNGACEAAEDGEFSSLLACRSTCEYSQDGRFRCTDQGCLPDDNGDYSSYIECLTKCKKEDCPSGCAGCNTDCPEQGCLPTNPKNPIWYNDDSNTCILSEYGALNPWESFDFKAILCCIPEKCEPLMQLFGKKWTIPWENESELDLKTQIIRRRDGTEVKIYERPVYQPPVYQFDRKTTPTLSQALNSKICEPVPIYDEKGCNIIDYDLPIFAEGECGYWESTETYPLDKDCNGNFIYGQDAGMPIRHILGPDESVLPHYISFQNGVPHRLDPANLESNDAYVILLGYIITGIPDLDSEDYIKPGCNIRQWKIGMEPRDDSNSRVIAKGKLVGCFQGQLHAQSFMYPNHGVNSLEKFSMDIKWLNDNSRTPSRGGILPTVPAYVFFSPDTQYGKPPLNISQIKCPLEIYGSGRRHGTSSKMTEPDSYSARYYNRKGCRQAIHLNHYDRNSSKILVEEGYCTQELCFSFFIQLNQLPANRLVIVREVKIITAPTGIKTFKLRLLDNQGNDLTIDLLGKTNYRDSNTTKNLPFNSTFVCECFIEVETNEGCLYSAVLQNGLTVTYDVNNNSVFKEVCVFAKNRREPKYREVPSLYCVKAAVYAEANKIVNKEDRFTFSLMNKFRESSVYLELEPGSFPTLKHGIDPFLSDNSYNGNRNFGNLAANNTCDFSFMGDGKYHEADIHNASCHYAVLLRNIPNQYGRIENAKYADIHLLTETESICGAVNLLAGDVYIGQYSVKRHSVVSDRVGLNVNPSNFFEQIFGVSDCGDPPQSGEDDPRNNNMLRPGNPWDGTTPFQGYRGLSQYWPGVLTSNNTFMVECKVNLHARILGDERAPFNEIYYPKLKNQELDPNFPPKTDQEISWLSRMYWSIVGLSKLDKLVLWANTIIRLAVGILMYGAMSAISLTSVLGYVMIGLGIAFYVIFLSITRNTNLILLLGIDSCLGDQDGGPKIGGIKGFHDLHNKYDWSKSFTLLWYNYGVPIGYNLCKCLGELNGRVYIGNKQNVASKGDAFRRFKINNYIDLDTNFGLIKNLIHWGNRVWAQTSDSIKDLRFGQMSIDISNGDKARLGDGGFFGKPYDVFGNIAEGKGGCIDPSASITSEWGHFFIDRKARTINNWTGSNDELSTRGLKSFFKNNIRMYLAEDFPDYPGISQGHKTGFSLGIDHRFSRILITKKDWKCKNPTKLKLVNDIFYLKGTNTVIELGNPEWFENRSFTLSYYIGKEKRFFVGFHSYVPDYYTWDRNYMYNWNDGKLWRHADNKDSYLVFYDIKYPFIIDIVSREFNNRFGRGFEYASTLVGLKNMIWDEFAGKWRRVDKFFDYIGILNNYQSSGLLKTFVENPNSVSDPRDLAVTSYNSMQYEFYQVLNKVSTPEDLTAVLEKVNGLLPNMLKDLIKFDKTFGNANDSVFFDEYLRYRFVRQDLDKSVQTILKYVLTKIKSASDNET